MRGEPLSAGWLSQWRSQVDAALETLLSTFEERYGYPPGTNEIKPPDGMIGTRLRSLREST